VKAEKSEPRRQVLPSAFYVLGILIATVFVFVEWRSIFIPIVLSVAIWYVILALSQNLGKLSLGSKRLPPSACKGFAVALVLCAGILFIDLIAQSVTALREAAPRYEQQLISILNAIASAFGGEAPQSMEQLKAAIKLEKMAFNIFSSAASLTMNAIIIFFYVLFLLLQQKFFTKKMSLIISDETRRERTINVLERIHRDVQIYIGVMTFLAIVTGIITYLVLSLVGVDFAILWSVIIALLSYIPTIGTIIGIAFPALIALLQFDTYTPFLIVLTTLGAAQLALNNFAQPALMGRSLNLSPFVILVVLALWGTIWGIVGALLSVPITVALMIVMASFPETRPIAVMLSRDGNIDSGHD
jgi:predicted PurR-regulated permease PerM